MPLWDLFPQGLLQLCKPLRRRFGSKPFEGRFSLLVDGQLTILWPCAIDVSGNFREPSTKVLDKPFGSHGEIEALTIFGDFRFTFFPGEKLAAVIHKLFRASNTQIARLEFEGKIREDTRFQVLTNKPAFALASDLDRAEPLLTGKGEINGCFQILFGIMFMGDDEVHRVDERLVRGG